MKNNKCLILFAFCMVALCDCKQHNSSINEGSGVRLKLFDSFYLNVNGINLYKYTSDTFSDNTMEYTIYHSYKFAWQNNDTSSLNIHYDLKYKCECDTISILRLKEGLKNQQVKLNDLFGDDRKINSKLITIQNKKFGISYYKSSYLTYKSRNGDKERFNSSMFACIGSRFVAFQFNDFQDSLKMDQMINSIKIEVKGSR